MTANLKCCKNQFLSTLRNQTNRNTNVNVNEERLSLIQNDYNQDNVIENDIDTTDNEQSIDIQSMDIHQCHLNRCKLKTSLKCSKCDKWTCDDHIYEREQYGDYLDVVDVVQLYQKCEKNLNIYNNCIYCLITRFIAWLCHFGQNSSMIVCSGFI